MERHNVVVIGGGQAGLAVSHELTAHAVEHTVFERHRVAQTWRDRWASFCLVTPNWSVQLPGGEYSDGDPDGFLVRDDIVRHLERYAASFGAPVREDVDVTSLSVTGEGAFTLMTSSGSVQADTVVICTGAYQRPHRPAAAGTLPPGLHQIDAESYRNPASLPPGKVLVVGSGQTGCQIAEELTGAGRDVFLACGRAPWAPRRIAGRDLLRWIVETPFMETRVTDLPTAAARLVANVQATGHGGGHDLNYRTLQHLGVTLLGRFLEARDGRAYFADDLADSVAFGDARYADLCDLIRQSCAARGAPAPELPSPPAFDADARDEIDLAGFGAAVFTSGFRPDYRRWVRIDAFDQLGFPVHEECASTVVPRLYFCGVHFLRKRKSSLLFGVGEDAAIVADSIARQVGRYRVGRTA